MAKSRNVSGVESYASRGALVFSGSLMVISIAFNNIGLGKIIDAYSQSIIAEIKTKENQCSVDIERRLKQVELLSHKNAK